MNARARSWGTYVAFIARSPTARSLQGPYFLQPLLLLIRRPSFPVSAPPRRRGASLCAKALPVHHKSRGYHAGYHAGCTRDMRKDRVGCAWDMRKETRKDIVRIFEAPRIGKAIDAARGASRRPQARIKKT